MRDCDLSERSSGGFRKDLSDTFMAGIEPGAADLSGRRMGCGIRGRVYFAHVSFKFLVWFEVDLIYGLWWETYRAFRLEGL